MAAPLSALRLHRQR